MKNKNYYKKIYDDKTKYMLENTKLTNIEEENICKYIKELNGSKISSVIRDIYIMLINNYSTYDIAKIYNKNPRTIQVYLKKVGLNRNRFEAQKIASKKRDYVKIKAKFKQTMLDRYIDTQLNGSVIESYIRNKINIMLCEKLTNYEVIVGINTIGCINSETDIPIIILKNSNIYKFIVEVDGEYFHKDKAVKFKDNQKNNLLTTANYTVFRLTTKSFYSSSNDNIVFKTDIDNKVIIIVDKIISNIAI